MLISVVIPVYKAEAYLQEAVKSALSQPETGEVILVEDNSPDGSLEVCRALAELHPRVRLVRHPNGENRGAGASRNLGILKARHEYIAFLDADDFYLPGRFDFPLKLLQSHPGVDGVYEAVGVHFESAAARERWFSSGGNVLTTLSEKVEPEHLFDALVNGGKGHFHLDGLLVRKRIFSRSGYFHENLRLHQDTAMAIQMAEAGVLAAGRLEAPVAMRRVHAGNRFSMRAKDRVVTGIQMRRTILWWAIRKGSDRQRIDDLAHKYLYRSAKLFLRPFAGPGEWFNNLLALGHFFVRHPFIAGKSLLTFRERYVGRKKKPEPLC
jgi:glycosyltransferase involved in cell wall biosynthesis